MAALIQFNIDAMKKEIKVQNMVDKTSKHKDDSLQCVDEVTCKDLTDYSS